MKTTADIRREFLEFFAERGHTIVPSSSLVPGNDPTLLFTNSGMVQFKDVFLGAEKRSYVRAADVQRCLRAGGKHNDLDQVGYTARHHTFFEMLGNWSFGDYFKKEAIEWAWELLTVVWRLPKERLLATVYYTDEESFAIWRDVVGLPEDRIIRIGDNKGAPFASDNFWQMADTGPCGPCTEIFYDHGEQYAGGRPGSPDEDGDRYIEIWNNVFMQFDRAADGTLTALPAPCVDTGMGLERITAVLQHAHSNYEIDIFKALIGHAAELTRTTDLNNKSLRVIADHIRAASFLIADGVLPGNEGRGYVLRRIIRRALRHGWMLGVRESFFHKLVDTLDQLMGEAYAVLRTQKEMIGRALLAEEERFAQTLDAGMRIFNDLADQHSQTIPGVDAFRLYDTYGFPLDLTQDMARERGMLVDTGGFDVAMNQQKDTARAAGKFGGGLSMPAELVAQLAPTRFTGYDALAVQETQVVAILVANAPVQTLQPGQSAAVLLDASPFYGESGGQVGDAGVIEGERVRFNVADTKKIAGQFHAHVGSLSDGTLKVGDRVSAFVNEDRRRATILNHSATHLLHAALREVLGTHVQQKGSLVAPDRLRFDFSHFEPMTREQVREVERRVNNEVRANHAGEIHNMGMQEALDFGAMALFGEKYGENVRVLKFGPGSIELCGGTHVSRTGDIGLFKIVSEGGVSSGVRRIEAVTGQAALNLVDDFEQRLEEVAGRLGGTPREAVEKLKALLLQQKQLQKELEALKSKAAGNAAADLAGSAVDVNGIKVVAARMEGLDAKALRDAMDRLKSQLQNAVILLAGADGQGKLALVAGVSGDAQKSVNAGKLLGYVAGQLGGRGGGRADMAQGGADDLPNAAELLSAVPAWVASQSYE